MLVESGNVENVGIAQYQQVTHSLSSNFFMDDLTTFIQNNQLYVTNRIFNLEVPPSSISLTYNVSWRSIQYSTKIVPISEITSANLEIGNDKMTIMWLVCVSRWFYLLVQFCEINKSQQYIVCGIFLFTCDL